MGGFLVQNPDGEVKFARVSISQKTLIEFEEQILRTDAVESGYAPFWKRFIFRNSSLMEHADSIFSALSDEAKSIVGSVENIRNACE